MGFRFRRTLQIAPGLKLNFSRSGVSVTAGVPGASLNFGKRGVYGNAGIPGTGLSFRQRLATTGGDGHSESEQRAPSSDDVAVAQTMSDGLKDGVSLDDLWYVWHSTTAEQASGFFAKFLRTQVYPRRRVLECSDGEKRALTPEAFTIAGHLAASAAAEALSPPEDPLATTPTDLREAVMKHAASVNDQITAHPELREALLSTTRTIVHGARSYAAGLLASEKVVEVLKLTPHADTEDAKRSGESVLPLLKQRLAWEFVTAVRNEDDARAVAKIHSEGGKTVAEGRTAQGSGNALKIIGLLVFLVIALALALAKS